MGTEQTRFRNALFPQLYHLFLAVNYISSASTACELIQTLKTIISHPVSESDLRGRFIVRLIDHLPEAGTQHQPTYQQANGNMIIIITPTNHRLTSFSLDYSAVTSLTCLSAIANI